jgi:hypothetical protein
MNLATRAPKGHKHACLEISEGPHLRPPVHSWNTEILPEQMDRESKALWKCNALLVATREPISAATSSDACEYQRIPNAGSCNALESLRLDYHCRDQIGRSHCHELDRLGLNAYLNTGRRISHTCMYEFIVPVCCINMTLIERFSSLRRV